MSHPISSEIIEALSASPRSHLYRKRLFGVPDRIMDRGVVSALESSREVDQLMDRLGVQSIDADSAAKALFSAAYEEVRSGVIAYAVHNGSDYRLEMWGHIGRKPLFTWMDHVETVDEALKLGILTQSLSEKFPTHYLVMWGDERRLIDDISQFVDISEYIRIGSPPEWLASADTDLLVPVQKV